MTVRLLGGPRDLETFEVVAPHDRLRVTDPRERPLTARDFDPNEAIPAEAMPRVLEYQFVGVESTGRLVYWWVER